MALTLTQVTAYDKDDKAIAPVSARMSSQASHGRVGNCYDGNSTDEKYCHSQKTKDKDPWLVFGYRADANISKIVVVNRAAGEGYDCNAALANWRDARRLGETAVDTFTHGRLRSDNIIQDSIRLKARQLRASRLKPGRGPPSQQPRSGRHPRPGECLARGAAGLINVQ